MDEKKLIQEEEEFLNLFCKEDPRMCPILITEDGELYQMFDVDLEG